MLAGLPNLAQKHAGFFDTNDIRRRFQLSGVMADADLIQSLLDPANTTPFAPNCIFDPKFYARAHGVTTNPIRHYLEQGAQAGLAPNALFDPAFFLRNAGALADDHPSLVSFALSRLGTDLVAFHPFIDMDFIQAAHPDRDMADLQARLFRGALQIDQPHPLFDVAHIRTIAGREDLDLPAAVNFYWSCGRDIATHPLFDIAHYQSQLSADAGVRHSVYHYLTRANPPSPHPLLGAEFYRNQVRATLGDAPARAMEHFLTKGQPLGLDPSPFFVTRFYQAQSGCGDDALRHYVEGGHTRFAPHPLINQAAARLVLRATDEPRPLAQVLAQSPAKLPQDVLPDFDADFYGAVVDKPSAAPAQLRDQYLRTGFTNGGRPNGLLSIPYIQAQCCAAGLDSSPPVRTYYLNGWHRRPRLLLALETLDDNDANRGWLALCRSQMHSATPEIIVVAPQDGPLSGAFSEVAHLWPLAQPSADAVPMAQLAQSGERLRDILRANPPVAALVEANNSLTLAQVLADPRTPMIAHGDRGLGRLPPQDLTRLTQMADHVLCGSTQVTSLLDPLLADRPGKVTAGFQVQAPTRKRDACAPSQRAKTRALLGLPDDQIIIVASGALDIDNGVDLFGALAAHCLRQNTFEGITFLWHGTGAQYVHTPFFYAQHFVRTVAPANRLRIIADPDLATVLEAADIYLKFGRDGAAHGGIHEAAEAGLPILVTQNHAQAADLPGVTQLAPFDMDGARDALAALITAPQARAEQGALARSGLDQLGTRPSFDMLLKEALATVAPALRLQPIIATTAPRHMLLAVNGDLYRDAFVPLGQAGHYDGLATTQIDSLAQVVDSVPQDLRTPLLTMGCDRITVFPGCQGMTLRTPEPFDHATWLVEGQLAELSELYQLGLAFDQILVRKPALVSEMSNLNPRIAAVMTVLDKHPS